jgi:hypothetical protein
VSVNNFEDTRAKIYADHEDDLFRLAMMEYAEAHGRELAIREKELDADEVSGPSASARKIFQKTMRRAFFSRGLRSFSHTAAKVLSKVAVVFLIVSAVFGALMMTVDAVRVGTLNFLINLQEGYTELRPSGTQDDIFLTNTYAPNYIPAGFRLTSLTNGEESFFAVFESDSGKAVYFHMYSGSSGTNIDTENAKISTIMIQNHEGKLIEKNGMYSIVWEMDGLMFIVGTDTSYEEAVRIAESVTYRR